MTNPGYIQRVQRFTPGQARQVLENCGATVASDFHALPSAVVEALLERAALYNYRRPRNANGSRARYFHAYLVRIASKES